MWQIQISTVKSTTIGFPISLNYVSLCLYLWMSIYSRRLVRYSIWLETLFIRIRNGKQNISIWQIYFLEFYFSGCFVNSKRIFAVYFAKDFLFNLQVHKSLSDVLATPSGILTNRDNFKILMNISKDLNFIINEHLAFVLKNLDEQEWYFCCFQYLNTAKWDSNQNWFCLAIKKAYNLLNFAPLFKNV